MNYEEWLAAVKQCLKYSDLENLDPEDYKGLTARSYFEFELLPNEFAEDILAIEMGRRAE